MLIGIPAYRQTLVHTCSWFGTLAPLSLLLKYGADNSAVNEAGQTPLHLAAGRGNRCGH